MQKSYSAIQHALRGADFMSFWRIISSLIGVVGLTVLGAPSSYGAAVKNCKVTFETVGKPVLVQIQGNSTEPCTGTYTVAGDKLTQSEFKMKLTGLETGIPLRNKHLRENYLHTEKFPDAVVVIKDIQNLGNQLKGGAGDASAFVPEMTIHGTTKPIQGATYKISGKKVKANFRLELLDFGIERPMFMGIKVVDAVIITVEFDLDA
jgi:polyisoprenoid-binding protein YceI